MNLSDAQALDRADPLAPLRDRFAIPEGVIYLDGNSLGALPKSVAARTTKVVEEEWGRDLITSWNVHDWIDLPRRVGERIAPLIGAEPGTVVVADSTSLNVFKLLAIACEKSVNRGVIQTESGNFPTDIYMAEGFAALAGREVRVNDLSDIGSDVAVVLVTEVNYRTGAKHDMRALSKRAHEAGALVIWDLCHSAGAFPVDLAAADADFAVGCGYKYLNGGPGAPAFAYVAPRHLAGLRQPLSGWLGHAAPFAFSEDYQPADGIDALRVGTPPVISMSGLDAALDAYDGVDLAAVRTKADALFELFAAEVEARCAEFELLTPRDVSKRGTQVSLRHPEGYAIMQALIARGVIGDFRQPDIMRFGLTPLYLRFEDVFCAAEILAEVMAMRVWDREEFKRKAKVV
ncbi:MAG: kynureninase [Devosia sp.]